MLILKIMKESWKKYLHFKEIRILKIVTYFKRFTNKMHSSATKIVEYNPRWKIVIDRQSEVFLSHRVESD